MLGLLVPGGRLLLLVPACPALYGDLDRLAGHHRRYRRRDLARLAAALPCRVRLLEHFNPLGGLGWWLNRFRRHRDLDSRGVNRQIVLFDRFLVPLSRALDPLTRNIFGQSLICVLEKAP
jgi:hypothetical protein